MAHNHDHDHDSMTSDPHAGHNMGDHSSMDHSEMNHDNGMNGMNMDHGMKMYFHACNGATILFSSWKTTTAAGMFGSCIAVLILATLYEGLKVFREWYFHRSQIRKIYLNGDSRPIPTDENQVAVSENEGKSPLAKMFSCTHFLQTILHIVQIGISYLLMLVFMTYNIWLCLSIVAGSGLGYFLFGWMKSHFSGFDDHCH